MKKRILAILLAAVMVAAMLPTALAADANYESVTHQSIYSASDATLTIDKAHHNGFEYEAPVGAVFTYSNSAKDGPFNSLISDGGPLCLVQQSKYTVGGDNTTLTLVHWCYDPAAGAMVKSDSTDVVGHADCPRLTAGTTYTFTVTEEMAESFSIFVPNESNMVIEGGRLGEMGREINARVKFVAAETETPAEPAKPASGTCGDNVTYTFSDGVLTIEGTGAMEDFAYAGMPWFDYCEQIYTVKIGNGVTIIGDGAFNGCSGLTSVTIPDGVTTIGDMAFNGCTSLTSVTIPASVTYIAPYAFSAFGDEVLTVYYSGSETQWGEIQSFEPKSNGDYISFADGGQAFAGLPNATVIYNSTDPATADPGEPEDPTEPETPDITFTDVKETDWFYSDVQWAVKNDWVHGHGDGTFTPEEVCNEEMILTLLHHTKDSPAPTVTAPVTVDSWYQDAVNWAYEQEIIDDTFQPDTPGTRSKAIYYLWKVYGSESAGSEVSFTDVPEDADYMEALAWAVKEGIVEGNGDGTFDPDGAFQRGHLVRFVHRVIDPAVRVNANS